MPEVVSRGMPGPILTSEILTLCGVVICSLPISALYDGKRMAFCSTKM